VGGYNLHRLQFAWHNSTDLDNYLTLSQYNVTKHFLGNVSLAMSSPSADEYWDMIQKTDGIVSVPTEWALNHYPSSQPQPDMPDQSIYQVDVFHSIHCLYRIRNRLLANIAVPNDDVHTLHCVDYLREQVMCHSDITLQATQDYIVYDTNIGHECRDHQALAKWVERYQWKEHKDYVSNHTGLRFKEAAADSPPGPS